MVNPLLRDNPLLNDNPLLSGEPPQPSPLAREIPELREARPITPFERVKEVITRPFKMTPEQTIAKASNTYLLSKQLNIPIKTARENYDAIIKQTGLKQYPTTMEIVSLPVKVGILMGGVAHPIATALGVSGYVAIDELENYIVSKKLHERYRFGAGKGARELLPEDINQNLADVIDIAEFGVKVGVLGAIYKKSPILGKKLTKQVITEYNMPEEVILSKEQVRDIWQTGGLTTAEQKDLFTTLNLGSLQQRQAIKEGVRINVPSEKVVTLVDKPYWAKIKGSLGIRPAEPIVTRAYPEKPIRAPTGLLEAREIPIAPEVPLVKPPMAPLAPQMPLKAPEMPLKAPIVAKPTIFAPKPAPEVGVKPLFKVGDVVQKRDTFLPEKIERKGKITKIEQFPEMVSYGVEGEMRNYYQIEGKGLIREDLLERVGAEKIIPKPSPPKITPEVTAIPEELRPLAEEEIPIGLKQYGEHYAIASQIQKVFPDKNIISYGSFVRLKRVNPTKEKPDLDLLIDDPTVAKEILEYNKRINAYIGGGSLELPERYRIFVNPLVDVRIKIKNPEFPRTNWYDVKSDGMARAVYYVNADIIKKTGKPLSGAIKSFYTQAVKGVKEVKPTITPKVEERPVLREPREAVGIPPIVPPPAEIPPPSEELTITPIQIKQIHAKAYQVGLIRKTPEGIKDTQYRRFLKSQFPEVYGIKPGLRGVTAKSLTQEQATKAIEYMTPIRPGERKIGLVIRPGMPPKIPTSKAIIPKDFADLIPGLKEIGLKERFRPSWRVFEKIGLKKEVFEPAFETEVRIFEDLMKFRKEALTQKSLVAGIEDSSQRIFRALDNTLPKDELLTLNEEKVVAWGKKFFDNWADKLRLPLFQRRQHYITHIFEAEISKAIKERNPIDPDLIRALDFITPKTIFNPFLQHRVGVTTGLKEDFWSAIEAYEGRELKVFHYQPLIQKIRIYERFLPPNSARYLRDFITRITNRPLVIDKELQQDFKELAEVVKKLPKGELLAKHLTRGNVGGMMAYNFTGLLYEAYLGLRPASAIKNLSQNTLTMADVGPKNFVEGKIWKLTIEGKQILGQSLLLRSRKLGYLPGVDETFLRGLEAKRRKISMWQFRKADQENVENAFAAGCMEAKNLGLPKKWWIRRGDEVAMRTQYVYTKLAGAQWSQSAPGRILSVLTTWPTYWAELMNDWIWAKPSQVYLDYEKMTGKKVIPDSPIVKRKALWRYLALVLLAHYIQRKTRLKALYYTGWTSVETIATIARGELAGIEHIGALASLIAAIAMNDTKNIKRYAKQLRPDRVVLITKQLEDIANGKKDWLSLFFLLKPKEKPKTIQSSVRYYENPLLHD